MSGSDNLRFRYSRFLLGGLERNFIAFYRFREEHNDLKSLTYILTSKASCVHLNNLRID